MSSVAAIGSMFYIHFAPELFRSHKERGPKNLEYY
jgi:hypothetical protein